MKNFVIAVMIFSGIALIHAGGSREIAGENLMWYNWTEEDWRNLTPNQADDFFPDPEAIATPDDWGVNPLIYASAYSSVATINRFIENGADVNVRFTNGWTALGSAIIAGNNDVVSELIEYGVDIDQQFGEDWVPLLAGIARENSAGVAKLIGAGANLDVLQQFDFLQAVNIPQSSSYGYLQTAESFVNAWKVAENKYNFITDDNLPVDEVYYVPAVDAYYLSTDDVYYLPTGDIYYSPTTGEIYDSKGN